MIKKIITLLVFIFAAGSVFANDLVPDRGFRFKDRTFELGLNAGAGFSNNLITLSSFTGEKMVLDITSLTEGLKLNAGMNLTPFYFKINSKNKWGFGLSTNVEASGNLGLSNSLITFSGAINDKSGAGFAVFADASLDVFFHIQNFKVKVRPSVFYTIAYSKPEITYTFTNTGITKISLDIDARVYTALKINDINNIQINFDSLTAKPGVDISFGIEYPLARAVGLYKIFALFDFDVGLDFMHIPLLASTMNNYMRMTGNLTVEGNTIEEIYNSLDINNIFSPPTYGSGKLMVERPFRTNLYFNWRLFGSKIFIITPNIGFSINPLYNEPFSLEYGLKLKLDLANIFLFATGANYEDRIWKNRIDIGINLRILEINIAAELRTNEFFRFTNTAGASVYAGIKLGF